MIIPCKECLVRAICRHKKDIKCDILFKWWFRAEAVYDYIEDMSEIRKYLNVTPSTFIVSKSKYIEEQT